MKVRMSGAKAAPFAGIGDAVGSCKREKDAA
jgi:hypothetical protein